MHVNMIPAPADGPAGGDDSLLAAPFLCSSAPAWGLAGTVSGWEGQMSGQQARLCRVVGLAPGCRGAPCHPGPQGHPGKCATACPPGTGRRTHLAADATGIDWMPDEQWPLQGEGAAFLLEEVHC